MRIALTLILFSALLASISFAETLVFEGEPVLKISENGADRVVDNLTEEQAAGATCIIAKEGDKYYWKSRNNTELTLVALGAFHTFIATNGSGYIRIIVPDAKAAAALMGDTVREYDYVEHLLLGLKSITYYGKAK